MGQANIFARNRKKTHTTKDNVDYTKLNITFKAKGICVVICGCAFFGIGDLFYDDYVISIALSFLSVFTPSIWKNYLLAHRRATLTFYFKQTLYSLSSSLAAGKSVENAFRAAIQDLTILNPDKNNDMIRELVILCARIDYGQSLEEALTNFEERAKIDDITHFVDVFIACKRTGADLIEVLRRTSTILAEKLSIEQEIKVAIAQKKFESKIMFSAPFLFLIFLKATASDFLAPLYTRFGSVISTFSLLSLVACFFWIQRIMNIKV